jgi:hypothetical protein
MRFPKLPSVVRMYVKAILEKDSVKAVISGAALRRIAAQRVRVEGCLTAKVLDHLAAIESGDKKRVRDTFVSIAKSVGVHAEVDDELRLVEGEGPERLG